MAWPLEPTGGMHPGGMPRRGGMTIAADVDGPGTWELELELSVSLVDKFGRILRFTLSALCGLLRCSVA